MFQLSTPLFMYAFVIHK